VIRDDLHLSDVSKSCPLGWTEGWTELAGVHSPYTGTLERSRLDLMDGGGPGKQGQSILRFPLVGSFSF